MKSSNSRNVVLGFIDVVRLGTDEFRAGYLLTSDYGLPIEFHYTSTVSVPATTRALYGSNLEPHVFAEVLARPMTDRQSVAPQIIAVADPALLGLRLAIPAPVVYLSRTTSEDPEGEVSAESAPQFAKDLAVFERIRSLVPVGFDWMEPFERIQGALAEIREPSVTLSAA